MSIGSRLLTEPTVCWPPPVSTGLGGHTWELPKQLYGLWQYSMGNTGPTLSYNENGSVIAARTSVWVSDSVKLGSYLWKGLISLLPPEYDAYHLASKVFSLKTVKSVTSGCYLYKVYLEGN